MLFILIHSKLCAVTMSSLGVVVGQNFMIAWIYINCIQVSSCDAKNTQMYLHISLNLFLLLK